MPMSFKAVIVGLMAGAGLLAGTSAFKESKMKEMTKSSEQVSVLDSQGCRT